MCLVNIFDLKAVDDQFRHKGKRKYNLDPHHSRQSNGNVNNSGFIIYKQDIQSLLMKDGGTCKLVNFFISTEATSNTDLKKPIELTMLYNLQECKVPDYCYNFKPGEKVPDDCCCNGATGCPPFYRDSHMGGACLRSERSEFVTIEILKSIDSNDYPPSK